MLTKHNVSNRAGFEIIGASTLAVPMNSKTLSVNSMRRYRQLFVKEASQTILSNQLAIPSKFYTIQWDSKIFKAVTHCGKNEERLVVLLRSPDGNVILLGIILVQNGSASEEHQKILQVLNENYIPLNKIAAGVFDTTAVNTGEISGVVKRLEASVGQTILQLACRHHIYELVYGAASEIVFGIMSPAKIKNYCTL